MQETEVINRILSGDTRAFSEVIECHKDMVYTLAMRVARNKEDAEEIVQDVFLKLYDKLSTFKKKSKLSTWVYRIAYNTAISKLRSSKHQKKEIQIEDYHIVEGVDFEEVLDELKIEEQQQFLKKAFAVLHEEERLLIDLFYLGERKIKEIEEITGQTASNIKVKLHRARKKMHMELRQILKTEAKTII